MTIRASKPGFNLREKLKELTHSIGLKGRELMRAATVQDARDLISAGRRNKIINGDFQVNQRDNLPLSVSTSNSGIYCLDRFETGVGIDAHTGTPAVLNYEHVGGPTELGFRYAFKITVTTAGVTQNANQDTQLIETRVETSSLYDLGYGTSSAKPMTLSFYVRSSAAGKYGMFIYRPTGTRVFVPEFVIKTPNVWQRVEIIIPGDTDQALSNTSNSEGMRIEWRASCNGTTIGTPMTGWGAFTSQRSVTGNIDLLAIQDATFEITGVQLEVGKNATEFEHRSYGEELALCRRYFEVMFSLSGHAIGSTLGRALNTTQVLIPFNYQVEKRIAPTLDETGGGSGGTGRVYYDGITYTETYAITGRETGTKGGRLVFSSLSGLTANTVIHFDVNTSTPFSLWVNAEL